MTHSRATILAVIGCCLAASACTPQDDRVQASLEDSVPRTRARMVALAPDTAAPSGAARMPAIVSLPPEAGAVASVRTRAYANGLRQDIVLKGSPLKRYENGITLMARTDRRQTLDEPVPLYKPSETGIRSEIGARYAGLAMHVADRESSNSYGPYGLALGRAGADVHCVFMWQWIDANRLPADAGFDGPVSIRVHLCQADATFDAMAAMLDRLTIGGDGSRIDVAMADGPADDKAVPRKASHRIAIRKPRHAIAKAAAPDAEIADASGPRAVAPAYAPAAYAAPASSLSRDLPPQAYLGPKPVMTKPAAGPGVAASY